MHTILAARTDFSVGESILTIDRLIEQAKEIDSKAIAVTDTMSITSMISFTRAAKDADIKPITGVRLRLTDDPIWRPAAGQKKKDMPREYYATLYANTEEGMKAIFRLLTLGASESRFYYVSKLGFDDLDAELTRVSPDALTIVSGDAQSVIEHPDAERIISGWKDHGVKVYMPLIPVQTPYYGRLNELSVALMKALSLPPIVVRPALYGPGEADAQEIMSAVTQNQRVSDPWFCSRHVRDLHILGLKDTVGQVSEMLAHMGKRGDVTGVADLFKEGLRNTQKLVDAVSFSWSKQPVSLPKMSSNEFASVVDACKKGWLERFETSFPIFGHTPTKEDRMSVYMARLQYELSILKKLEFSGYFLLVQDIVRFAKSNGILVGPGRGSVGGSLVAYLMGITECDPIRFGLLFERFINPERLDLPDADLDFMSERRHEIVEYLVQKYGRDRVAGVNNYSTLAAASSIRDVGKALGISEREYSVSKYVPKVHGANVPLPKCREKVVEIDSFAVNNPEAWEIMERLEGTTRNFSQHAAGIVIGGVDLVDRGVVERRKETSVMCWDKDVVESQGLVKVDVLGLRTLDLIALVQKIIEEDTGAPENLMSIPLDDEDVLASFAIGKSVGIFQYEGGGARRMLKEMGSSGVPVTFEDVSAVSALNRPGPLDAGLDRIYIENRDGRGSASYLSPHMESALRDTFGAIVYQEQVMQISKDLCGFTGSEADVLRKAIGKKDPVMMNKMRSKFVSGAVAGYMEVTLEDGTTRIVHRARTFKVLELDEKFTLEDVFSRGFTLLDSL